jgi:hypothetical protein
VEPDAYHHLDQEGVAMPYKDLEKARAAKRKSARKAYAANPEKFRKRRRDAYAADPEKGQGMTRKYRMAHPKKVRETARKARLKRKPKTQAEQKLYKTLHSAELSHKQKMRRQANPELARARDQRQNARRGAKGRMWGVLYRAKKKAARAVMAPEDLAPILAAERSYQRLYQSLRRARVRALPATFSREDQQFMLQYWGFACAACGNQDGFAWRLALDHWIPIADQACPGTTATNVVPLCHGRGGCNNAKSKRAAHGWLVERFGPQKTTGIEKKIARYFAVVNERHSDSSAAAD